LATTYFAQRETWRARRALVVSSESGQFIIRKAPADEDGAVRLEQPDARGGDAVLAALAAGERVSAEVLHAAQRGIVILQLPAENVALRRLSVPAQARDFVAGIVRNQIERLSPWQPDEAIYGFDTAIDAQDAGTLEVCVLIAARALLDGARDQLAACGLTADRVVTHLPHSESGKAITLWSRLADISPEHRSFIRRRIGIGIAAAIAASVALTLWAMISANHLSGASADVTARIDTLERHLHSSLTLRSAASLPPNEREWYDKETSPSVVVVLEALSRALPDSAYLTELSLESARVQIVGLAKDAPSLIAPLEHSGALTGVHFFSPTTREPDGAHFRFHIEGRAEPYNKPPEHQ
jgi:general secretion pathway protein L